MARWKIFEIFETQGVLKIQPEKLRVFPRSLKVLKFKFQGKHKNLEMYMLDDYRS